MKLLHIIILIAAVGLAYMVFFAKQTGPQGGPPNKNNVMDQLVAAACKLEDELMSKYGNSPPPSAKTDPLTIDLMMIFKKLQDLGMKTQPVCPGRS